MKAEKPAKSERVKAGKSVAKSKAEKKASSMKPKADLSTKREAMKRPACAVDHELAVVSASRIGKSMPSDTRDGSNPSPVLYKGGVVYTVQNKHKFRGLRVRNDTYTETSASWGGKRTKKDA